ncbi:hypothetical protein [Micromonospora sp. ATA51]|uniref:hypothetical protein n=1 Tax=Micromonospora sp. ATA51 TaxID=2806098 RepID=UPI001EE3B2D6|nr:hypothetical protein [Micromonospora sp. ATA51]
MRVGTGAPEPAGTAGRTTGAYQVSVTRSSAAYCRGCWTAPPSSRPQDHWSRCSTRCCHQLSPALTNSCLTVPVRTNRFSSIQEYSCHGRQPNRCSSAQSNPPVSA